MAAAAELKADARAVLKDFTRWLRLATGVPHYHGRYEVIVVRGEVVNAHETWTKKPAEMPG